MTTEEFTNPEPPGHPVLTPREIGQRPGVATMNVPGWGITGRAPSGRLWGSNQEDNQGLRCINMPGVEVKRVVLGNRWASVSQTSKGATGLMSFNKPPSIYTRDGERTGLTKTGQEPLHVHIRGGDLRTLHSVR
jgi:hypothetical protein